MGCPEAWDTSENSSAFCLGGSSVSLNSARTQRVTSGRLATIPPAAAPTDEKIDTLHVPVQQCILRELRTRRRHVQTGRAHQLRKVSARHGVEHPLRRHLGTVKDARATVTAQATFSLSAAAYDMPLASR